MNLSDKEFYCRTLAEEAAGLRQLLNRQEAPVIEYASEECEKMTLAGQRELTLVFADLASRHLRDIDFALQRLEEGTYGVCVDCDGQIPARRLRALPWASRCVGCQESTDCESSAFDVVEPPVRHDRPSLLRVGARKTIKRAQGAVTGALAALERLTTSGLRPTLTQSRTEGRR
jgi:DnaK suppressor protein